MDRAHLSCLPFTLLYIAPCVPVLFFRSFFSLFFSNPYSISVFHTPPTVTNPVFEKVGSNSPPIFRLPTRVTYPHLVLKDPTLFLFFFYLPFFFSIHFSWLSLFVSTFFAFFDSFLIHFSRSFCAIFSDFRRDVSSNSNHSLESLSFYFYYPVMISELSSFHFFSLFFRQIVLGFCVHALPFWSIFDAHTRGFTPGYSSIRTGASLTASIFYGADIPSYIHFSLVVI